MDIGLRRHGILSFACCLESFLFFRDANPCTLHGQLMKPRYMKGQVAVKRPYKEAGQMGRDRQRQAWSAVEYAPDRPGKRWLIPSSRKAKRRGDPEAFDYAEVLDCSDALRNDSTAFSHAPFWSHFPSLCTTSAHPSPRPTQQ
jgi:hypothetical protein